MSDEENDEEDMYDTESIDSEMSESDEPEPILEEYKEDIEDIPVTSYQEINLKQSLAHIHTQEKKISYEEVLARCSIVKDVHGNIQDPRHTTPPFITKYEIAKVLGMRATQIEQGAPLFIDVDPKLHDSYVIAKEEFNQKKIPFIIARPIPNGEEEYWKLSDLEILM
jgi:DNA-directed RNA polymerase subunit K/omega